MRPHGVRGLPLPPPRALPSHLVSFPPQGPSYLPKNLHLLSLNHNPNPNPSPSPGTAGHRTSLARLWSDELYSAWKPRVLPADAVREVSLVKLPRLPGSTGSGFELSCVARVMACLGGMREKAREELLGLITLGRACSRRMGRVRGLWGDLDGGGFLYLVCERMMGREIGDLRDDSRAFFAFGVEIAEALIGLHSEGFVAGFVGLPCFGFDELGRACVVVSEVLVMGRKVRKSFAESVSVEVAARNIWKDGVFVSPEMLSELLCREGVGLGCGKSGYSIGYCSDTWPVACLLLRLLVGEEFAEEYPKIVDENGSSCSMLYSTWVERLSSLLDSRLGLDVVSVKDMITKCFTYDPGSRPLLSEVRRSMRELIIEPQFDLARLKHDGDVSCSCIVLGELCQLPEEMPKKNEEDNSEGREGGERDLDQAKNVRVDKYFVDALSEKIVKFKDLHGHRDCITGVTVGGGLLFSSSLDKTIRVWSLQDFTHVHTFEGHEHKVMAIVYVNREQPLCISGDSGGGVYGKLVPLLGKNH